MILRIFIYFFPKQKTTQEVLRDLVQSITPEDLKRWSPIDDIKFGDYHKPIILGLEHGISFKE